MPTITIPIEATVRRRGRDAVVALSALSAEDKEAVLVSWVRGSEVEARFEGDPVPYLWRTADVKSRESARGSRPQPGLLAEARIVKDLANMPSEEKQALFADRMNSLARELSVYLGPALPPVRDIPAGDEGGSYEQAANGTYVWTVP